MEDGIQIVVGKSCKGKQIQDLQSAMKFVGEEFKKYEDALRIKEYEESFKNLYKLLDKQNEALNDSKKRNFDLIEENKNLKDDMKVICDKLIEFGQKNSDLIIENNRLKNDKKTLIEDMDEIIREREHCARMYKEKDKELKKVETELHNDIAYLENELNMANENIEALRYNHGCRVDELNEYEVILNKYKSKNKDLENRKEALKKCCDYYRAECKRYKDAINNHNMTKELIKKDNKINVLMEEKKELLEKIDDLALENVQNDEIIVYNNEIIEDLESIIDLQEEEIEKLEDVLIKNYLSLKLHKSILDAQGISFNEERVDGNKFSVNVNINENANIDEVFESLKRFNKMYGVK